MSDIKPHVHNYDKPSKSQVKRDMIALQKLGEMLVELTPSEVDKLNLDARLSEAINTARGLKNHEARRRQLQYIGKLMRNVDAKPIEEAINKIQSQHHQFDRQFHHVEQWRDKLLTEGDNQLQAFLMQYPDADRQQLRQLIRSAQQNQKGAKTELFRLLRQLLK